MTDREKIDAAIARFPETFGLRAYDGIFRISPTASYISDGCYDGKPKFGEQVMLYVQRYTGLMKWEDFCKGTESDLRSEIVTTPSD